MHLFIHNSPQLIPSQSKLNEPDQKLTQQIQCQLTLAKAKTLSNQIILTNPYPSKQSTYLSITQQNSPLKNNSKHPIQHTYKTQSNQTNCQSQVKYFPTKNYLYFHERQQRPHSQQNKKFSFPFNPIRLCYFQNNFSSEKNKDKKKINNFNSNQSIRNFLDSKLKTEPTQPKKSYHSEHKKQMNNKQIYVGRRLTEYRKQKTLCNIQKQKVKKSFQQNQSTNNSIIGQKLSKISKFPLVLKIKSKKAYFLNRFKNKLTTQQEVRKVSTIDLKQHHDFKYNEDQEDNQPNPFQTKFRSKTEDNINLINQIKNISLKQPKIKNKKNKKIIYNSFKQDFKVDFKEDQVDPWEFQNHFMDSSLKFHDKY